jgi:hypothetical protein
MVIAGMQMPPGLDLLLFSACATTRGVRSVPIPLLKEVRSCLSTCTLATVAMCKMPPI